MRKLFLSLIAAFIACTSASAQNFPYGQFSQQEMSTNKFSMDTSAHAYVLNEYGDARIDMTSDDQIKIIKTYHVKIKIIDTKGFDKGNVEVPLYTDGDSYEVLESVKGITTYREDGGGIHTSEFDGSKVYQTKQNKYWTVAKFTMPNLRPGCIVEYTYRFTSPFWSKFPSWEFQSDIPKITSLYEVHIPAFWSFNAALRGSIPLSKNTSEVERSCFTVRGASCDCSHIVYGMNEIPAFIEEDYMTSPKNFLSAINFSLVEWINPYTNAKTKVTKEWKDIDYNLKKSDYFGTQLRKKDQLKKYIDPVIAGKTDDLEKAKAVYQYIQKNIKWNNIRSRGSDEGIRKALDSHTGNVGDINLALVTAMGAAGLNCEAVLLSTRDNGLINKLYPVEDEFDYVIAKLNIGEKTYLLDATDPMLSFGMLPLKCLNDQGRVMSLDKPSYWIDLAVKQRKASTTNFDLTLQPNGKLTGTVTTYSTGYEGYQKRKAIRKFNSTDEWTEHLDESLAKIKILKANITNLDSLDEPLGEKYEVEIDMFDNLKHERMAFNPFIMNRLSANPFKLNERSYPVDWGMPSEERYTLVVNLPAGYVVETPPTGSALALPNAGGRYIVEYSGDGSRIMMSNITQFNKSVYAPEEYPYLKELYNKMIAAERAEIVFKKKS